MKEARLQTIKEYEILWTGYSIAVEIKDTTLMNLTVLKIREKEAEMLGDSFTEDDLDKIVIELKAKKR